MTEKKTLNNINAKDVKTRVSDVVFWGDGDNVPEENLESYRRSL